MKPYASSYKQLRLNSVSHQKKGMKIEGKRRDEVRQRRRSAGVGGETREGRKGQYDNNALYTCVKLLKMKHRYLKRRMLSDVGILCF